MSARQKWPKLSETLPGPPVLDRCQSCGKDCDLDRWQECDSSDQPTPVVVVLCDDCEKIIDPHPRLYHRLEHNQPMPGAMWCCDGCCHRDGLLCRHPDLKANGGRGLPIKASVSMRGHLCGRGAGGGCQEYVQYGAAPQCDGFAEGEKSPSVVAIEWHLPKRGQP